MKVRKLWLFVLTAAFAACIVFITVLSRTPSLSREMGTQLFRSWQEWMAGDRAMGQGILLNIGLFVPFGYLLAALFSRAEDEDKPRPLPAVLLGLLFSLCVELVQLRTGRGMFEVDDLLHNTLGAALGLLLYWLLSRLLRKKGAGRAVVFVLLPALMLVAGALGCWKMKTMVVMTNLKATEQFWFSVDAVDGNRFSGRCRLYEGDTPDYQILLTDGSQTTSAQLTRDGEGFTAEADFAPGVQYELQVQFKGFSTLSTGVYLRDGGIAYVPDSVSAPVDENGAPLVPEADLKACSADWDCYVYQSGTELIWLVGDGVSGDIELICHLHTNRPDLLPEQRQEYGFDNLGFHVKEAVEALGGYRLFRRSLPTDYPVTEVVVGLNPGTQASEVVWNASFRP